MFSYVDITDCTSSVQLGGCGRVVFTGAGYATGGDIHPTEPYALIMVWGGRAGAPVSTKQQYNYLIRVPLDEGDIDLNVPYEANVCHEGGPACEERNPSRGDNYVGQCSRYRTDRGKAQGT